MRMRHNYLNAIAYVNDIGAEKIQAIQEAAGAVQIEPCPFCGGEPVLFLAHFPAPGCGIECSKCHIKTLISFEGTRIGSRTLETIFDCLAESVRTWSRRYNGKADEKPFSGGTRLDDIWRGMD